MDTYDLTFEALLEGGSHRVLDAPPRLRLAGPEHGWIDLVVGEEGGEFAPVTLSQVYPPLADLWAWSLAVAWGLMPVTVRLDEESNLVYLMADMLPEDRLRIELTRAHGYQPPNEAAPEARLCWVEPRQDFLRRWGRMWAEFLGDGFDQAHWDNDPEPMRDMPWEALADVPALEPPPWTLKQRIAWFYLVMAYQLGWRWLFVHQMDYAELALMAAESAARCLPLCEPFPPPDEASDLLRQARRLAHEEGGHADGSDRLATREVDFDARQAVSRYLASTVTACLPYLPFAPGSFIADEQGRRAVILRMSGREWLLYWDDGRITREDAFHAARHPSWRWPVAYGPVHDPNTLDEIDARRLRFLELDVSPVRVVCPVCGYPCMDDDVDEVQSCDICGYPDLWQLTHGRPPALDAAVDEEGDPISPTLRERRAFFLAHGDAWPTEQAAGPDDDDGIAHFRHPERQRMTREAIAEWDAWLQNPESDHRPEEVWRRWNRWQTEQRSKGGYDGA